MNHKTIVFTGGGSAGHVIPNIALINYFLKNNKNYSLFYIGSIDGIEKSLIKNIPYYAIQTGKLKRQFSLSNFIMPFKVLWGLFQSIKILNKLKPDLVFSKGGFVSVPVVIAARLLKIKIISHESDLTPGLANKINYYFVNKLLTSFEDTKKYFKNKNKILFTGSVVRPELLLGNKPKGLAYTGLKNNKPILLIMGGSLGAHSLNKIIRKSLDSLLEKFEIIHLTGKNNSDNNLINKKNYCQLEYINTELADIFACSNMIISRAGANSLFEILALNKPHLLIPLDNKASRGDQIDNANYAHKQYGSSMILEKDINNNLVNILENILKNNNKINFENNLDNIIKLINENVDEK